MCAQVDTRVIQAMKARDKELTSTLRLIKTALTNAAKESGVEAVSDEEAVKVLRKMYVVPRPPPRAVASTRFPPQEQDAPGVDRDVREGRRARARGGRES